MKIDGSTYFSKNSCLNSKYNLTLWSIWGILSWLEFRPKNTFIWCDFVCTWLFDNSFILENSFEAKKVKSEMTLIFHFISHIFIWKQCHLWTIECEKIKSVHRWHCFHMKIWATKRKIYFFKNCTFLFIYHIFIWKQCHLWTLLIFWNTKTLTARNFAAPWGTWTSSTFLEASNLTLFGARWSWGWQDF